MVLLTGARQTGKTSLLRNVFPNHSYVTLDLPSEAEQAERAGASFLERHRPPLIVDEVQYAPGLLRHLKPVLDSRRSDPGQYLLTGSQKLPLLKGVGESLAGRVGVIELEGLSLGEIHRAHHGFSFPDVMLRGGYPELYADIRISQIDFYRSYVTTYLERDLRSALHVASLRDFERFLRACALRSGQLLNKADLARDVGISASTASEWLGVLVASNLVLLLEPWFQNRSKSITKSPKLYFTDTGLLLYLLNVLTVKELLRAPLLGAVWETFVFSALRKKQVAATNQWSIHFFRDRTLEVDFLIYRGGVHELIEVKWTENPAQRDTASLETVAKVLGPENVARKTLICRTPNPYPLEKGVEVTGIAEYSVD